MTKKFSEIDFLMKMGKGLNCLLKDRQSEGTEPSERVKEVTQVERYHASLSIDVTVDKESLEFTDLVVITDVGFISAVINILDNCFCLPETFLNKDDIYDC